MQQLRLNRIPARLLLLTRVVSEDMIHLLQRASLRLGNEEVGPYPGQNTEDGEEDICAVVCVFDERWCN
jgi:hypothetical protein